MCLHPTASPSTCGKVIHAHTIQRSRGIGPLATPDKHVLSFYPHERDEFNRLKLHRVGWKKASTFLGFCNRHDGELFSELENCPFVGNDQQCFLVGYRALCHELYQKLVVMDTEAFLRESLDKGKRSPVQWEIQDDLSRMSSGWKQGIEDLYHVKKDYDRVLTTGSYDSIHRIVLNFEGTLSLASTGRVTVDFDVNGIQLQNLATVPVPAHGLSFGIVTTERGGAFIATWPASLHQCDKFVTSLLAAGEEALPTILVEFVFAYVENTYFSEDWWTSLPQSQRDRLETLAGVSSQYGRPLEYSRMSYVDWKILDINLSHPRQEST